MPHADPAQEARTGPATTPPPRRAGRTGLDWRARLVLVGAVAVVLVACFLFLFVKGPLSFTLPRRATFVGAMAVVAFTQAVATVAFHTVTGNRILSPSIIGFDSLYVLMQTAAVFALGGATVQHADGLAGTVAQTVLMVVLATLLYRWLFTSRRGGIVTLLLVGIVLGLAFDSLSSFLQRLLSPTEFDVLQLDLFGRMGAVEAEELPLAVAVCALVGVLVWRRRDRLDVLLLGPEHATALGLSHRRELTTVLVLVSVLYAFSTALAGPMTFFGFLVATLAYQVAGDWRHRAVLPMAFLLGFATLVGGQFVLQHVFSANGYLTILLEGVGGLVFLTLLLRKKALT